MRVPSRLVKDLLGPGADVGLAGRAGGRFRPAGAKVYPPDLNNAIAASFAAFVASLHLKVCDGVLSDEISVLRAVGEAKGQDDIQPDYHR